MLLQNCCYFQMLLRLKQRCLKYFAALTRSFTFSFPRWPYLQCQYQVPVAGGAGCPEVLGTYSMHPEWLLSVLSCGRRLDTGLVWLCRGMGQWVWGLTPCCYLRGDPDYPQWLLTSSVPQVSGPSKGLEAAFVGLAFACVWLARQSSVWKAVIKRQKTIPWQIESAV